MRKVIFALLLLPALYMTPVSAEVSIATIKASELIRQSPQYQDAETRMKKEFERRFKKIETDGKKLGEDLKAFQKDADVMSPGERARVEKELNARRIDQTYAERKFNEDSMIRQRELAENVMKSIAEVIKTISEKDGYDVVLQDPVYASSAVDITDKVLAYLRKNR